MKLCAEYIRVKESSKWDELYIAEEDDVTGKSIKIDIPAAGGISIKSSRENSTNFSETKKKNSENLSSKENNENNENTKNNKNFNFNSDSDNSARRENEKTVSLSINEFYLDQMNSSKSEAENTDQNSNRQQSSVNYGNLTVKEDEDSLIIDFNPDVINPFGRKFSEVTKEIKEHSPFRRFETYSVNKYFTLFYFLFSINS